jgi:hypothetical protein
MDPGDGEPESFRLRRVVDDFGYWNAYQNRSLLLIGGELP